MFFKIDYTIPSGEFEHLSKVFTKEEIVNHYKQKICLNLANYLMEHSDFITDEDIKAGNCIQKAALFFPDADRFKRTLDSSNRIELWDDINFK